MIYREKISKSIDVSEPKLSKSYHLISNTAPKITIYRRTDKETRHIEKDLQFCTYYRFFFIESNRVFWGIYRITYHHTWRIAFRA